MNGIDAGFVASGDHARLVDAGGRSKGRALRVKTCERSVSRAQEAMPTIVSVLVYTGYEVSIVDTMGPSIDCARHVEGGDGSVGSSHEAMAVEIGRASCRERG